MTRFLLVALGGALGSSARYGVTLLLAGAAFPVWTLTVNLVGSLLIGVTVERVAAGDLRLFLVTGILGGFTTYSAFNQETVQMLRDGAWGMAFVNVAGTLFGCLVAGFAGVALARYMR
jgi:fluoride exporter